ncbi:MAG: CbtA family protein [SAR202 cluster bacterium]|nr:CbtA family protein [SAR202 cluster bacterium]
MPRIMPIALILGLAAGLLVGGFHFFFTVPVIEQAIALEEEHAAAEAKAQGMAMEEEPPLVSLGAQSIGLVVGATLLGLVVGLVYTGGFHLLRRAFPAWKPLAVGLGTGLLGFWAFSLFPFFKYPLNPPGVGDPGTLVFRQSFQTALFLLSAAGVAGLLFGWEQVNRRVLEPRRNQFYLLLVAGYAVLLAVLYVALPNNPDPVNTSPELLQKFRTLSVVGHFLLWLLLGLGVGLVVRWYMRTPAPTAASPGGQGVQPAR